MANRRFTQFYSTLHHRPVQLDCSFTVDATNSAGISGLSGPGIANVFMHTSTTPVAGNPNPASGYILVQFQDNYNKYFFGGAQFESPNSGSSISISGSTVMTVGAPYTITAVGSSTTANWVTAGVPVGITPAVGVTFFAAITGGGTGTGTVQAPKAAGAGVLYCDVLGVPNTTINCSRGSILGASGTSAVNGPYMILRCMGPTFTAGAYTPAGTVAAPALTMNSYTPAGTNDGASPPIFTGTPAVLTGTNSAPAFTGTAASLSGTVSLAAAAPAAGTVVSMCFILSNHGSMASSGNA